MKKGTKVIYNNAVYEVLEKRKQFVIIYNPAAALPELTKISCGVNHVKEIKRG